MANSDGCGISQSLFSVLGRFSLPAALITAPFPGYALPEEVVVTHGNLQFSQNGRQLDINQTTQHAIANWQSFSIGANETVNIQQLNASAALLNRVTGADPSQLLGQMNANGRVFLINPNGVVVGENAHINAAEFIASTLDIADADFLNGGDSQFSGDSTAGIVNLGSITSADGDIVLIASKISNEGLLQASQGEVALAAGNEVLLTRQDNQRLIVKSDLSQQLDGTGIDNAGVIDAAEAVLVAAGGDIYDLAINQSGIIKATGVNNRQGRILLTAEGGDILFSGQASAKNADGSGGDVYVGGGFRGEDAGIVNADHTQVTQAAVIDVSSQTGDAGTAVVWADLSTDYAGTIAAGSTAEDSAGGLVEVSGKRELSFSGFVDLNSERGLNGTLLLDPDSLIIQDTNPLAEPNILLVSTLQTQLESGNVILDASAVDGFGGDPNGTITVGNDVSWTSGNSLTLNAGNNININGSLAAGSGDITLGLGFVENSIAGQTASLAVDSSATITANRLTINRNASATISGTNASGGPIGAVTIDGALNVATLDLQLAGVSDFIDSPGISGDVSITNAANRIGSLTNTGTGNGIEGSLTIVDSAGGLDISGDYLVGRDITISTVGDLTLNAGANITTAFGGSNIFIAAQNGSFINNAGASALATANTGRFLVYSDNPDDTTLGGLAAAPVYNRTFAANAPATITQTGNRVLYSLAPTLILTANNNAREPGEANPTLTFSISGLVGGDVASDVFSGLPVLSTTADAASPIGDYAIDIANGTVVLSDYGYQLSLVPGTLSVALDPSRVLTVTANDLIRIYGDPNPAFTSTITGFRSGDDASVVSGLQFITTATPQSPVGNYTITPFGATAANYSLAYVPGTLTVDFRDLTITADSIDKVFGQELTTPGFSISGLASFDTEASLGNLSVSSAATARLANVGSYTAVASGVTNTNYNVTYVNGTINVTPAALTITANNASRIFGAANPDFSISTTGLVSGDTLNTAGLIFTTAADINSDVGTYNVTPGGITDANYDITYAAGALDITPALLTLTADNFSRDYGSANPVFTLTPDGLVAGDTLADVVTDITLDTTATQDSSAGRYRINLSANQISNNYNLVINNGTLDIDKVDVDLFLALASRLYGDPNPTPTVIANGLVNGDTASVFRNVFVNYLVAPASGVGSYTVQFLGAEATNYRVRSLNNGVLNVLPRPLTITADSFTREYGDENPQLTATFDGLASFDDASDIDGLTINTVATAASGPLDYGINLAVGSNPNYTINLVSGLLTVTPAVLAIEIGNTETIYGRGFTLDPTVDFLTGLKLDDLPGELGFEFVTDAAIGSDAGDYAITATLANPNYALDIRQSGTLFIRPAPLTIDTTNFSRTYGEANPEFTYTVNGLALGDSPDVVSLSAPELTADAGTYNLDFTLSTGNYELANVTGGLFTILPRNIAIKPENIIRFYGDPDPAFNYLIAADGLASFDTIDDIMFADNPLVTGSFGPRAPVGVRTILARLRENPNYAISNQQGYHAILPRPIEIKVDNATATGNFPLPRFTATATNLAEFDTLDSAIPNLSFRIFRDDELAPVQVVQNLEDFEIPAAFDNDQFIARFPSTIGTPDVDFEADPGSVGVDIVPIDITNIPGTDVTPVITIGGGEFIIASNLFSSAQQESEEPVVQYIQAIGGNPNYVIVANTNGALTWEPDPKVAEIRREIEAEQAIYNEAYDAFFNADEVYGNRSGGLTISSSPPTNNNLLGLPDAALGSVLEAVGLSILDGNEDLANMVAGYGASARGSTSFKQLTGGAYSNFDTLAFLQAARTDPVAAEMLGLVMSEYVLDLIEVDPTNYNVSQQALADHMSSHINAARQGVAQRAEAQYNDWVAQEEAIQGGGMASLFGTDTPYGDFIGVAAADYLEEHFAGQASVVGGGVLGGTVVAATTGLVMAKATSVILPNSVGVIAAKGAIIKAGGTVGAVTGVGVGAAVVPVAIIAGTVAGSIARAVQVVEEDQQRQVYEMLTDTSSMQLSDLTQTDEKGDNNTLNQVILATALSSMFSGI
ncbi:filamentous hemagglutinin N-terminal domain-containing protein [Exilibacterium tricleocarpae]|uniref:Filamentous hemagglutinin N-terminal domain-containing protein n=1 Tax=Exilibacterium tricleocarpae TaxID=2591008 RepID=A0A545TZH2_9GAMM|nr:MBG domain-containing protein [Exilibacterium tricleocarpae]TQV82619.1 filamentous hemagglutinin N-terminal domain-containing protein [Exilibacterium tricleocarpae]